MSVEDIQIQLIKAREEYIDVIKTELMGPGSEFIKPDKEHELISSRPTGRYVVGILYPNGVLDNDEGTNTADSAIEEESQEVKIEKEVTEKKKDKAKEVDETADENLDEEISMTNQYKPSSMGITFLVKGNPEEITAKISFATYSKSKLKDCVIPPQSNFPDGYEVPFDLSGFLEYDAKEEVFRLKTAVNLQELRRTFERDTIPEAEAEELKKISYRLYNLLKTGYVREPHIVPSVKINFGGKDYYENDEMIKLEKAELKLVALRKNLKDDIWSVTIMLVNNSESATDIDSRCIFQAKITISTDDNNFSIVPNNANLNFKNLDDEEQTLELLYRNKKQYATGLGVATDWNVSDSGKGSVWTEYMPKREIPSTSFSLPENNMISNDELSMKYLSDLDKSTKEEKLASLKKMIDLYVSWIEGLKADVKDLESMYRSPAIKNIEVCQKTASRMYAGLETLRNVDNAFAAFELANRAMFMQRVHLQKQSEMAKVNADRYPGDQDISDWLEELDYSEENDSNSKWRPFQIAFLLMDINSIVYDDSEDRDLVDLIWFPTGGGKTEAYLGLTAFTIFYRKLAHPDEAAGTTVIMRYTLRLLAAQQFTRAATLICACECIREDCQQGKKGKKRKSKYKQYALGKDPITIGLWIGGTHIPNKNTGSNSAEYHLKELTKDSRIGYIGSVKERHNKFQVLKCPWCGTKMVKDEKNHKIVGSWGYLMNGKHFYMVCPHEDCTFTTRLPIQIIDEELYDNPPTLLFGTVDKFAMMAWEGKVGNFFGVNSKNRAPELIIQDELHLISGALGTMVGLYETAVDKLSSMKGIKPKFIASTATIRRAKEQCSVLYNREVVQFPAPGINAEDSFFARENIINHSLGVYGRTYIGVMPSGKSKTLTEVRCAASLLQRLYAMELDDSVKDKFWTLTAYYNSLRDLGKASALVEDDIKDAIIRIANRLCDSRRLIIRADELTSRVTTTDLNETLDKLERVEYSQENIKNKMYASNILLATNMISVGIDVARLNVMLMVGQPKLTSEYIQASSRVGRSYPGMAFIQYDASKSRDRSHYERFRNYHDSFYRFVEPTGATPFSKPARERALHAVIMTLLRQKALMLDDGDANMFDKENLKDEIGEITQYILTRVEEINKRSANGLKDDLDAINVEINDFLDYWQECVDISRREHKNLCFGKKYMVAVPDENDERLIKQFHTDSKDRAKETLTSMRNVDTSVSGSIIIWEEENGHSNK